MPEQISKEQWDAQIRKDYDYAKRHEHLFKVLYPGKFLLIHFETLISSFDSAENAAYEGMRLYEGKTPYSVYEMRVRESSVPYYFEVFDPQPKQRENVSTSTN